MPEVIDRFRSSTRGWLRGTLYGWLTIALCLVGAGLSVFGLVSETAPNWLALSPVLLAAGLIIILVRFIQNLALTYELTTDRLILRKGIFIKSIDEIELYRVKNVRLDFSLINQMVGIGSISLDSSDETTRGGALVIPYIEKAVERREELRTLVDAARQKRRVRELDVASDFH